MGSFLKLAALSWYERWLLVQAFIALPITALALRVVGFKRWQTFLTRLATIDSESAGDPVQTRIHQAHITARMVSVAAGHGPYRANCLQRSLVLWWLLRRRRIACELCIGVRKEAHRLEAHAWVEHRGLVLDESGMVNKRFTPFERAILPVEAVEARSHRGAIAPGAPLPLG